MAKRIKQTKTSRRHQSPSLIDNHLTRTAPTPAAKKPISALNDAQRKYIRAIASNTLTFGTGPAGTGKTFVCGALAAAALAEGLTERIIITRPAVEAGRGLGFLPGELEEKFDPYFEPFKDVLEERLGSGMVEYSIKAGKIQAKPLEYMRGKTFKDAWVILDEAQNTTPIQMKLFLTRIGESCTVIVNGDLAQKDIRGRSGLEDAIKRLYDMPDVAFVEFTKADIVRSGLVQEIVERYEDMGTAEDDGGEGLRELPAFIHGGR